MRWCEQSYFSTKLISTLFRPALRLFLRNVQESVLSEAKARPPEDLRLLLDERSLCLAQRHALFSPALSKGHREHPVLLADHPGHDTKTRARDLERRVATSATGDSSDGLPQQLDRPEDRGDHHDHRAGDAHRQNVI